MEEISREIIKPSSPTPHHLRSLKFSYLDQLQTSVYIPLIFFYQADESRGLTSSNHPQICHRLKQSMSDTLSSFYPAAGRITNSAAVDCNDAGAEFVVARAHARLTDAIRDPEMDELKQYFPVDPASLAEYGQSNPLLRVQMTLFDCGGVAVSACFSHKIGDLKTAMTFFTAWAAAAAAAGGGRSELEMSTSQFKFGTADLFPPFWFLPSSIPSSMLLIKQKRMTKRFIFSKEKIGFLKKLASSSSSSVPPPSESETQIVLENPTRVEVLTAFFWKHLGDAEAVFHTVNVRTRISSPPELQKNILGNCFMSPFATIEPHQRHERDFRYLVGRVRSSIRRVAGDYITRPLNKESYVKDLIFKVAFSIMWRKVKCISITSWLRIPAYEVDYGWGTPIWFTTAATASDNIVKLLSGRNGDDVEVMVTSGPEELAELETQIKQIPSTDPLLELGADKIRF